MALYIWFAARSKFGLLDHISEDGLFSGGCSQTEIWEDRRGIVFQYRADDAFQLADGVWKDTGIMICGQRRELVRCDAGVLRLPKSRRYPEHPFGHAWH